MNSNKMMIIEKNKLLSEKRSIAEFTNKYFVDISKGLNLKDCPETNVDNTGSNSRHSLKNVLFEDHVSVKTIREKNTDNGEFRFQLTASQKDNYGPGLKKKVTLMDLFQPMF